MFITIQAKITASLILSFVLDLMLSIFKDYFPHQPLSKLLMYCLLTFLRVAAFKEAKK